MLTYHYTLSFMPTTKNTDDTSIFVNEDVDFSCVIYENASSILTSENIHPMNTSPLFTQHSSLCEAYIKRKHTLNQGCVQNLE